MKHPYIAKRFWNEPPPFVTVDPNELASYKDLISLSIGDTDFTTDSRIIDAAFADAKAGHTRYTRPAGDMDFVNAIIGLFQRQYGLTISADEVFVTASSLLGMSLALFAILDSGDEVLLISPYFSLYKNQVELAGGVAVEVPTYEADGFCPREEALRSAITSRTRAIIVNNPCNPTGAAYDRAAYEVIANVAKKFDLIVLADEIYTQYMYDTPLVPMRSLPDMAHRTITLNSLSKDYLMTGWRVGYVVADPCFTHVMENINENVVYSAPSISQRAGIYAIEIREEIREYYVKTYKDRVFYASDRINRIAGMSVTRPGGTFYLFPSIKGTGLTSAQFCDKLLKEAHVLTLPGSCFGAAGEGYIRIACTIKEDAFHEAFDRMEQVFGTK